MKVDVPFWAYMYVLYVWSEKFNERVWREGVIVYNEAYL